MKVKIVVAIIALLIISGVSAIGAAYYFVKIQKVSLKETAYIYISPDDDANSIMDKIQETAQPQSMIGFRLLAHHNKFGNQRRSGRYAIYDNDNMHSIYRRIVCKEQTPVKVVVPATRTIPQLLSAIEKQLMLDSTALSPFTTEPVYYTKIGYTKETLPSLFLPNTYEMYWDITPERFMIRMMKERRSFWNEERTAKATALGLTIEEVATLASIVDEETNNDAEKPIVAGLYINRLKRGMLLQADPTVKYALGDFARKRILHEDLKVESPYNTYKYKGLPPGPIRIPTLQAIESVLNYKKHNYLYMCAKEDLSGTHNFARTLSEHNANAQRYQQALNKLNIKQ
ncbi:MAG: endolytic transglycosylase MltG [Bacteroidaceae bacterium]|nr:endolytic transglycosylase MltG [Bacteroidaceae bacterium]